MLQQDQLIDTALAWNPRLPDNGESFPQLVSHEYILRFVDTTDGVPGETKKNNQYEPLGLDPSPTISFEEAANASKRAFNGVIRACKVLYPTHITLDLPASDYDSRDVLHATRLLERCADPQQNTSELRSSKFHVGIIGAGMAGLYTAMILKSLGITFEVLEGSDRIGGRVYTHRFSNDPGDYYDVGAMRFPQSPIMKRTFNLFSQLGIEEKPYISFEDFCEQSKKKKREQTHRREWRQEQSQKHGDLIPYYLTGNKTPSYFNDHLVVQPDPPAVGSKEVDPHSFSYAHGGSVPNEIAAEGATAITAKIFANWRSKFLNSPYPTLLEVYEKDKNATTVRQELMESLNDRKVAGRNNKMRHLTLAEKYHITNWCETLGGSTCHFDGALVETFIHTLDFNYPTGPAIDPPRADPGIKWWCLNGGADILADEMTKNVGAHRITKNARVTAIRKHSIPSNRPMRVAIEGNPTEKRFSHVIATTTTSCLQTIDLTGVRLQNDQREAIRVLRYEPAVKMGIKFSKKWWIGMGINRGGQGKTDRPTRVVVYPSYALEESPDCEGVLLACYNSSTDATRLGALARGSDPTNQKLILDVVLHDLALMHGIAYKKLRDWVVAHHFHDWSRHEFSVGAWGDFAPGQFTNYFTSLQVPAAGGNLYFAGELTSMYHGWIVAALNSAHRAVYLLLLKEKKYDLLEQMTAKWGELTEHDIPSALCFVSIAERGEYFANLREECAAEAEQNAKLAMAQEAMAKVAVVETAK